jgi:hypothetical protein
MVNAMHPSTKRALELLERLDGVEEIFAAENAQRDPDAPTWEDTMPEREPQPLVTRDAGNMGLVYKVRQDALVAPPRAATMDDATQRVWDAWANSLIAVALRTQNEAITEAVGGALASERQSMRKFVRAEIAKLRAELKGDGDGT